MRLVLSGYYGFGNAGDEWVLAGLLRTLRELDPALEAVVPSGDPVATEREHGVEAIPRMHPGAIVAAMRGADGLVSGGGSLLQDRTSARPVPYYVGVMLAARALRRPYVVHAQGLGPIRRRLNRALAAAALRGAAHVSLRDADSLALARELGVRRSIDLVPDPALALPRPVGAGRGGHIAVALRPWPGAEATVAAVATALAELAAERRILAVPMQPSADTAISAAVVTGIPGAEVLPPSAGLDERRAALTEAHLVIGMRLHALIVAAGAGVPAVALSYDPKVDAFSRLVGQPLAGHVGDDLDASAIVAAARRALAPNPAARATVERLRDELRAAAAASLGALGAHPVGPRRAER